MQANLNTAISYILDDEGAAPNIGDSEPGGASKYGVSVPALNDYWKKIGKGPATIADVVALTASDATAFYAATVAPAIRFNDLPSGVDYRLLDIAVNLGNAGAVRLLQSAFPEAPRASDLSDAVVAYINSVGATSEGAAEIIVSLTSAWLAQKQKSLSWPKFGKGWTTRAERDNARAIAMVQS